MNHKHEAVPDRLTGRPQDFGSCCVGSTPTPGMTEYEARQVAEWLYRISQGSYSEHQRVHVSILVGHLNKLFGLYTLSYRKQAPDWMRILQTVTILRDVIGLEEYGLHGVFSELTTFIQSRNT